MLDHPTTGALHHLTIESENSNQLVVTTHSAAIGHERSEI